MASKEQHESVGDIFTDAKVKALTTLTIFFGIIVYLGGIVYSGVHNYQLMTKGVPADLLIWAIIGIVGLEITAIFVPVALHYWTHDAMHRMAAFAFYGVDLLIIFLNVVLDFAMNSGNTLPSWGEMWLFYVVPASPLIVMIGWSILFLLDPSHRERQMLQEFRASTRVALMKQIAESAKGQDISDIVEASGRKMALDIVQSSLGLNPTKTPKEQLNGHFTGRNTPPALPPPTRPSAPPRQFRMSMPVQGRGGKLRSLPKFISNRLATTVLCPTCGTEEPVKDLGNGSLECLTCHSVLGLVVNPTNGSGKNP